MSSRTDKRIPLYKLPLWFLVHFTLLMLFLCLMMWIASFRKSSKELPYEQLLWVCIPSAVFIAVWLTLSHWRRAFHKLDLEGKPSPLNLTYSLLSDTGVDPDSTVNKVRELVSQVFEQCVVFTVWVFGINASGSAFVFKKRCCEVDPNLTEVIDQAISDNALLFIKADRSGKLLEGFLHGFEIDKQGVVNHSHDTSVFPGPVQWEADLQATTDQVLLAVQPWTRRIVMLVPVHGTRPSDQGSQGGSRPGRDDGRDGARTDGGR